MPLARRHAGLAVALLLTVSIAPADTFWNEDVAAARRLRGEGTGPAEWTQALTLLEAALAKEMPPQRRAEVQFLRGCAAYDLGDAARAVAALREAVSLEPTSPLYRLWLGYAYDLDDRTTLAVQCLRGVYADPQADAEQKRSAAEWLAELREPVDLASLEPTDRTVVPGAVILHDRGDPNVAAVREALAAARAELRRRLGIELDEPVQVLLFGDAERYHAYHERRDAPRPEWSTACSAHGRIYTYGAAGERDQFRSTLIHEYTHLALRSAAGDRTIPCWIDEGLAVLFSGQFPAYRSELRRSPTLLGIATLMAPSFSILPRDEAYLAYTQSKAMAEALLARSGPGAFGRFVALLDAGGDAEAAFAQAFEVGLEPFWRWFVEERVDAL